MNFSPILHSTTAPASIDLIPDYKDKMPSDKIDKKRKRASDRHERPSKKPALELQDLPPLSASTVEDHSELAPVIGILPCLLSYIIARNGRK